MHSFILFSLRLSNACMALLVILLLACMSTAQAQTTQTFTFTNPGSIVTWTVPGGVSQITIEARGAEGREGDNSFYAPGKGAIITGTFPVTPGQQLSILVGGRGASALGYGIGGGGSFVVNGSTNQLLIVAGGGGGGGGGAGNQQNYDAETKHGQAGNNGGKGTGGGGGSGGTSGGGGQAGSGNPSFQVGGGGGYTGDGGGGSPAGKSFTNGGAGAGGFGGGGYGITYYNYSSIGSGTSGAGGGGYSGGGGGGFDPANGGGVGGGGGSYNAGIAPVSLTGATAGNSGDGLVKITYGGCTVFVASLSSNGPLSCTQTAVRLTASGGTTGATYTL